MPETTCPMCGGCFVAAWGTQGAPEDGQRELYCSEECRDRGERVRRYRFQPAGEALRGRDLVAASGKTIRAADAWDILDGLDDPFAEL